jgi:MFS family permease
LIAGGSSVVASGLVLAAAGGGVATMIVATLAIGAGFGFTHSTMQVWATEVAPAERAVTVSLFTTAVFVGAAATGSVAGPAAAEGRFAAIFLATAVGALLVAIVGSLLRSRYLNLDIHRYCEHSRVHSGRKALPRRERT